MHPLFSRSGWNRKRSAFAQVLAALFGLAILVGCSTQHRHKLLTFFFDGVPGPGATNRPVGRLGQTEVSPIAPQLVSTTNASKVVPVQFVAHPPYEDRQCAECHKSQFDVKMKGTQQQVCFACHDNFAEKAKFKHQPVENSECTACHQPHGSPNKGMLKLTGKALCLDCHDDPSAKLKFKHQPVESGCADCHSPHVSSQPKLLTKESRTLCLDCHDDPAANAKFKHQPIESGCLDCHSAHASAEEKLLNKPIAKLCLDCHEQKDIDASKGHQGMAATPCLTCHDPHMGADQHLLKPKAPKAPGVGLATPFGK